jgi:hypothetical protein
MSALSTNQQTVLDFARTNGGVPTKTRIDGIDPRALPSILKSLVKAGELSPIDGFGHGVMPTETEQAAINGVCGYLTELGAPPVGRVIGRCGVVPAGWHGKATRFGGGCSDDIDLAMRDAFLTRVTDKSDKPQLDALALKAWGEEIGLWNPKWEARNPGMQRMNLTNRVRAALRNGKAIVLNGVTYTERGTTWQVR